MLKRRSLFARPTRGDSCMHALLPQEERTAGGGGGGGGDRAAAAPRRKEIERLEKRVSACDPERNGGKRGESVSFFGLARE